MLDEVHELIPPGNDGELRVATLRRSGRLQLVLPTRAKSARTALELYSAQRTGARLFRWLLKSSCALGFPLPLKRESIPLRDDDAFVGFLRSLASGRDFELAILAGNPGAEGRRWLCLVFSDGAPAAIVKAGVTSSARELIAREFEFLTAHAPSHALIPIANHCSARVTAFTLPFVPGHRDRRVRVDEALRIVLAWVKPDAHCRLSDRSIFHALSIHAHDDRERDLLEAAGRIVACETLMHGDFAPWNLKRDRRTGDLCVLDWERGEARGVPGWDILHFIIQPLILVRRENTDTVIAEVDSFLSGPEWASFSQVAGIAREGALLAWSYLLHAARAQPQSEGCKVIGELLHHYTQRCAAG